MAIDDVFLARADLRARFICATYVLMVPPKPTAADQKGIWCDDPIGIKSRAAPATVNGKQSAYPLPLKGWEGAERI
jgi:hypothetical protein